MRSAIKPMLASPAGELPSLAGWAIEPKWDGIRVIAELTARRAHLWSRNGIDKAQGFADVTDALHVLREREGTMVLDGELIAVDARGKPLRFQALQQRGQVDTRTAFIAFDCLAAHGEVLVSRPFSERRRILESLIPVSGRGAVRRGGSAACGSAAATRIISAAQREGWEGLIAKRMDSTYQPGKRSPLWRKVKFEHEQEFVIGGYTLPTEGADRNHLGALLVGFYDAQGNLVYAGKIGTGYTRATLEMLGTKLGRLRAKASPFMTVPRAREMSEWVKPVLVAQVRYNEMTANGMLRQPVFLGLRDDKKAADVRLEAATTESAILAVLRCTPGTARS